MKDLEFVENNSPWEISIQTFHACKNMHEKLTFLIKFAVLAPSSHNSQPWSFRVKDNSIIISKNISRCLPVGDYNDRQLFISLGCATKNIMIAANYYGFEVSFDFNAQKEITLSLRLDEDSAPNKNNSNLIFAISKRQVNRGRYSDTLIQEHVLSAIKKLNDDDLSIHIINKKEKIKKLADIILEATSFSMSNKDFRAELSHYLIHNKSKKEIGMPGFGLGFPTPLSYLAPYVLKTFNMSKLSNKKDEVILKKYTPYLTVISTKNDDELSWIKAGLVGQEIFLQLTNENIAAGIWAAPIQIGDYFKKIQQILGNNFRPQFLFRIGYPIDDMGGHSPRLSAEKSIMYN